MAGGEEPAWEKKRRMLLELKQRETAAKIRREQEKKRIADKLKEEIRLKCDAAAATKSKGPPDAATTDEGLPPATKKSLAKELREEMARVKEEVVRIRTNYAMQTKKINKVGGLYQRSKVLKVKWEKVGVNYTTQRLRELFGEIGKVEDVMIKSYCIKRHNAAIVVMASEDDALLACQCVVGDLSNPLWIKPTELSPRLSKLFGPEYNSFEDSVLGGLKAKKHVKESL